MFVCVCVQAAGSGEGFEPAAGGLLGARCPQTPKADYRASGMLTMFIPLTTLEKTLYLLLLYTQSSMSY